MTYAPHCECGRRGCYPDARLPHAAWEVAGHGGAGAGPDGADLCAILPEHFNARWMTLVEERDGWSIVLLSGKLA